MVHAQCTKSKYMFSTYQRTPTTLLLNPFDLNVDQFDKGTLKSKKSKYMVRFNISKNPIYLILVEIKQSLILDPNLDQLL